MTIYRKRGLSPEMNLALDCLMWARAWMECLREDRPFSHVNFEGPT